jgi:hypothetical protein
VNSLRAPGVIDPAPVAAWLARGGYDARTRAEAIAPELWRELAREVSP